MNKKMILFFAFIFVFLIAQYLASDDEIIMINQDAMANEIKTGTYTYLNYLQKLSDEKEEIKIAVIGSSVTKGSGASDGILNWPSQLMVKLNEYGISNISLHNFGTSRFKAEDLLRENKVAAMVKESPDIIIFETAVINNYLQSTSLRSTIDYINKFLHKISSELPAAVIIVSSPNPIDYKYGRNEAGYFFEEYLVASENFITYKEYPYVDIYNEMNNRLELERISINEILKDGIHPNDAGYRIWTEILFDFFETQTINE